MILGGTFAVLAVAGGSAGGGQIQQIGYGVAAGVLMDTFLLRSLLVPSLVVLLGRWNWWPSHLARTIAGGAGTSSGTSSGEPLAGGAER
jgi:putative drug exporter of the RND superfamily